MWLIKWGIVRAINWWIDERNCKKWNKCGLNGKVLERIKREKLKRIWDCIESVFWLADWKLC